MKNNPALPEKNKLDTKFGLWGILKYLNNLRVQDRYLLDLAVLPFLINERSVNSGSGTVMGDVVTL